MKRTTTPSSRANMPKGMIWSSLNPRRRTQLILTGSRPSAASGADSGENIVVSVGNASNAGEAVGIDGVHRNGDPVEAGVFERLRHFGQKMSVGGNGDIERLAFGRTQLREVADEVDDASAKKWFAASEADLRNAERGEYSRHTEIVREWQLGIERALVAGAAVDTLVIATVRDRDPEVVDVATVVVV